ncbi:MAG TPA: HAD-IA family hydrolase [Nevskiaceae bacterium]|nr:HAD-IA family hydrolase [Nevskiaceae bacterium]
MDEIGLGKRLQAARMHAGLTQQALCQQADLSYSTLTKIERGAIKSPSIFTIQNIAAALNVGLDELLGVPAPGRASKKKHSQSGVAFVYFDINGCLVHFFQRAFTLMAADTGVSEGAIETAFWHYNDQACRGELTLHELNQAFAEYVKLPPINWLDYYLSAVEPITGMHQLVQWAADNYHVGLLSNIMPGFIDALRDKKMLPDVHYDAIIDSSVVKLVKPEAAIYELATERSRHQPSEILLVDDTPSNLMPAEKLGWHVMWFDDYRPEESAKRIREALEPAN